MEPASLKVSYTSSQQNFTLSSSKRRRKCAECMTCRFPDKQATLMEWKNSSNVSFSLDIHKHQRSLFSLPRYTLKMENNITALYKMHTRSHMRIEVFFLSLSLSNTNIYNLGHKLHKHEECSRYTRNSRGSRHTSRSVLLFSPVVFFPSTRREVAMSALAYWIVLPYCDPGDHTIVTFLYML